MLQLVPITENINQLCYSFTCKHFLENASSYLFEIKTNDEYGIQWVQVDKDLSKIRVLHLQSLDSSYEVEERFFEEGYLKFNENSGIFIEKFNSAQYHFQLSKSTEIPSLYLQVVQDLLSGKAYSTN